MNWDTRQQNILSKNYSSSLLTVKSIRRFTTKEQEDLTKPRMDNKSLWPYWVEFTENITQENSSHPDKTLFIFKNTYYYKEEKDSNPAANKEDVFYYFAHHLDKKSIAIPFSKLYYNNILDREGRLRFYCLSDSSDFSTNKDVNKIITEEKKKWDDLVYSGENDLNSDNKKWVNEGVHKDYKTAFANTNLKDNPSEVKKWQEGAKQTGLTINEASTACQNEWLPNEIKNKLGSTDNQNNIYNVLTLNKSQVKKAEQALIEKLAQKVTAENRESIIKDLEELSTTWTSNEEKAVLNNNQQKINDVINKLKQIQQQKTNAIQTVENHWNQNKDNNGKVNGKNIEELLGSNWKDNFDSLTTAEQIKKEQDRLTAIINQAKEEADKKVCNIAEHQKLKEEKAQLTQQKELNEMVLKAVSQINQSREEVNLVSLSKQKEILGESWEENLANQVNLAAIQEQQKKLVNLLKQAQTNQAQEQEKLEKQIQKKMDEAKDFIQGKDILSATEQEKLLNELQFFIDNWGLNSQADLAQEAAFHSQQTELLKILQELKIQLQREEIAREVWQSLKDPSFPLEANDLSQDEFRNYPQTLQNYDKEKSIKQFGARIISDTSNIRAVSLHAEHLIKEGEEACKTKKDSLIPLVNLVQHRTSPANLQERTVLTNLRGRITPLIAQLTELERQNASERIKQWLQEQKVSEENLNRHLQIDNYQNFFARANVQDLLEGKIEERLKKTIVQLAQQQSEQRALIIDKGFNN